MHTDFWWGGLMYTHLSNTSASRYPMGWTGILGIPTPSSTLYLKVYSGKIEQNVKFIAFLATFTKLETLLSSAATSMHDSFQFLHHFSRTASRKPNCNDRTTNPGMHLHSCAKEVPTLNASLHLLSNHVITSPPGWLWGNQAGVWGEDGTCAAGWQAAEDIHRCIYRGWRQAMSLWVWWAWRPQSHLVLGCLTPPTVVTQAHELSRSTPVQPSHQQTALGRHLSSDWV